MVDSRFRHDADDLVRDPFPEDDVLVIDMRFDFALRVNIKYLQCLVGFK